MRIQIETWQVSLFEILGGNSTVVEIEGIRDLQKIGDEFFEISR